MESWLCCISMKKGNSDWLRNWKGTKMKIKNLLNTVFLFWIEPWEVCRMYRDGADWTFNKSAVGAGSYHGLKCLFHLYCVFWRMWSNSILSKDGDSGRNRLVHSLYWIKEFRNLLTDEGEVPIWKKQCLQMRCHSDCMRSSLRNIHGRLLCGGFR